MYFTRHMRLLEKCAPLWPLQAVQAQISNLRQAFSADVNRAFELRANFPYGSPSESYHPTPPPFDSYNPSAYQASASGQQNPITPPASAQDMKTDSSPQTYGLVQTHPHISNSLRAMNAPVVDEHNWNPTRIMT